MVWAKLAEKSSDNFSSFNLVLNLFYRGDPMVYFMGKLIFQGSRGS